MAITSNSVPSTGYVNGSDMLLYVGDKAVGHCTSHTATYSSETKDHAVKPPAKNGYSAGLWKGKAVTGLGISVKTDGLMFYNEEEYGYPDLLAAWAKGEPVKLKCAQRSNSVKPYLVGDFVITSLEEGHNAQDDSTYSASFDNDGEPETIDANVLKSVGTAV